MSTGAFRSANATVSAHGAVVITPSNSTTIEVTRGLFVGTAGDIAVTMADGQIVTFLNIANATILPIQVQQVRATGTTATNILALY